MKKIIYGLIFIFAMTLFGIKGVRYFHAKTQSHFPTAKLETLMHFDGAHPSIGLIVKDLETNHILYSRNENQYFMPASNQKVFTAALALQFFSPDFTFDTTIDADLNKLHDGHLKAPVKLIFSGDPTLKVKDLHNLIKSLADKGINVIEGPLNIDLSAYDDTPLSPGASIEDAYYCWMAPLTSAILNHNCVAVKVKPNMKIGEPIHIVKSSTSSNIRFESTALTYAKGTDPCIFDFTWTQNKYYLLKGCLAQGSGTQTFEFANPKPHKNLKVQIQKALANNHIELKGPIKFITHKPLRSKNPIAVIHSKPISVLIKKMMKDSDNLIANAIFKTIGAKVYGTPGSFNKGGRAFQKLIQEYYQVEMSARSFIDGAGTSRYNFITPNQMMQVLSKTTDLAIKDKFIDTFPIGGVDGSLKNRLKSPSVKNKVWAKTGSMSGVSCLSGFIKTKSGKTLAFTLLINGYVNPLGELKTLEDNIVTTLAQF